MVVVSAVAVECEAACNLARYDVHDNDTSSSGRIVTMTNSACVSASASVGVEL